MPTNIAGGLLVDGAPVLPVTTGAVFYVKASGGSDGNDGKSPDRAFATLAQAITACTANNGDVIILLPGAHSWSASVAASKAGIKITGLAGNPIRPKATITTSAADEVINITAADVEISHLRVISVTQKAGIDFTSDADRLYIHDVSLDMATPAAHTSTVGIGATTAAQTPDHVRIERVYVECDGAQGPAIAMGDSKDYVVKDVTMALSAGTWAVAASAYGVTNQRGVWEGVAIANQAGSTVTKGITGSDLTSASSVLIKQCFFGDNVTKGVDDFGAGDAVIVECYQGSIGGGSGGALVTAIT